MSKTKYNKRSITNLYELVESGAVLFGDKDLFRFKRDRQDRAVTFSQFKTAMDAVGTAFCELDLHTVAVIGETSPEWILTYLATVNGSKVIIPLDKELAPDQIAGFIKKAGADCVVYSKTYKSYFENPEDLPQVKHFIVTADKTEDPEVNLEIKGKDTLTDRYLRFEDIVDRGLYLIEQGDTRFTENEIDMEKMCAIIFTSGTTGTSKGVMLNQKALTAAVNASHHSTEFNCDDTIMSVLPVHHTYEMTCGILTPILVGITVCINDGLKYVLKNLNYYKPTGLVLVPLFVNTIYKKIWDTATKNGMEKKLRFGLNLSSKLRTVKIDLRKQLFKSVINGFGGRLRLIVCGGAALNPEMVTAFEDMGISMCQGYGITECAPLISVTPIHCKKTASVGPAVDGLEVMIDRENPTDEAGEILVKGDNVMMGYFEDPDATAEVLTEDGWFATGDYGYIDSDGYIYVTGRKKNVIVLENGKNVFPEEIESYLEKLDLVCECAVVGRLAEDKETVKITAIIYPSQEVAAQMGLETSADIAAELKTQIASINKTLPSFKHIRGVEMRKTEFDKTTSHKIKRHSI
ncbi:MAG: long-chain fatty acid--CoA ligase [Ruminococcaceae bacterium]|nr:long-chain fatty acid--CoA ligase [Oscillospiraceae bacterium]